MVIIALFLSHSFSSFLFSELLGIQQQLFSTSIPESPLPSGLSYSALEAHHLCVRLV